MKRFGKNIFLGAMLLASLLQGCKPESVNILKAELQLGQPISDAAPLSGSIKGTFLSGKTYTVAGDIIINKGDTAIIQNGVNIYMGSKLNIIVKGTLISLGTQANPVTITQKGQARNDTPTQNFNTDPAYAGYWNGISCDTTCALLVLKWTHIEYTGALIGVPPVTGANSGGKAWAIFFQNPKGTLILEDSYIYGTSGDPMRISGGKINIMRNTFEKNGKTSGDCINIKSGTVGNIAYNLFVGQATNGPKVSNNGATAIQSNVNVYNNTIVNGGWRTVAAGRGASIDYEEGGKGLCYNNLIVNCKFGFRVLTNPAADTLNLKYGNNYSYVGSAAIAAQIYPYGYALKPQVTDIPMPSTFLPANYKLGQLYDGSSVVNKNDPLFVNYPLPANLTNISSMAYATGFNFRLQIGSPAIGKGFIGFAPLDVVKTDPIFGASEVTPPGKDMGAFQSNGTGNQH